MKKKSVLSGMILTIIIMIVMLVISEAISITVELLGEELISAQASIILDLVIMVVTIIVAICGLLSHAKQIRAVTNTMNGYVERLSDGDVDWEVDEAPYKEYDSFVKEKNVL